MNGRPLVIALGCTTLAMVGCRKDDVSGRPLYPNANVLIVTLDTVRADRLGVYGHDRDTTPNLDALARESVRFDRAFAQSSFTPPSHAALLTSRYVSSHGLRWWNYRLPDEVETVAETFSGRGYRTASFSPLAMGSVNGLDQGFERVVEMKNEGEFRTRVDDNPKNDYLIAPASAINERVFPWLAEDDRRPFLGWVHYYDAHRPFAVFTADRPYCNPPDGRFGDGQADYRLTPKVRKERKIGPRHVAYLKDRYDSGLKALDAEVGRLIATLRESGALDDTILVITADHGEAFDEFDEEWFSHDPFLYDVVTRVPLFIRLPDGRFGGEVVDSIVELVDVVPTLLDYTGVESPFGLQGASLRPAIEDGRPVKSFAVAERQGRDRDGSDELPADQVGRRRSLRLDDRRLMIDVASQSLRLYERGESRPEQPEQPEQEDVWDPTRTDASALLELHRQTKQRLAALEPETDPAELTEERRRELEALGYLSGGSP